MAFINGCGGNKIASVQAKTITSNQEQQIITPNQGYDAIGEVTVDAIPSQSKTVKSNGIVTADENFDCLSTVTTKVSKIVKTTTVTLTDINTTSTPPYYMKFSIPMSTFNNECTTLPEMVIICITDSSDTYIQEHKQFGIIGLFLHKSDSDDTYSGKVCIANPTGSQTSQGLNHGVQSGGEVESSSCLTINNSVYEFYLACNFLWDNKENSPSYGNTIIAQLSTYDVTFIWN